MKTFYVTFTYRVVKIICAETADDAVRIAQFYIPIGDHAPLVDVEIVDEAEPEPDNLCECGAVCDPDEDCPQCGSGFDDWAANNDFRR